MKTRNFTLIGIMVLVAIICIIGFAGCEQPAGTKTVAVTGVTLDKEEITLFEEGTYTLTATVEPSNASNKSVSWESDDEDVATVSNTGVVTAVAVGTATITVTTADGSFTKECEVTVKPLPVSIEVTKSPTAIKIGEQLDLDEIEVTATYSDDSEDEAQITLENITGFNPNTAGKQTVTVTYAKLTDTFDVWVLALSKIEVSLIGNLSHILIGQGEEIDLEDITVTATWKNESDNEHVITEAVAITMENLSAFDRTKADTHTVTVTYGGKTDTFEVLVLGVTSIVVTTPPTKTRYIVGEQLDFEGFEVTATFSDGETEPIHANALHITGFDTNTIGNQTVTVTYSGHSDTFEVTVVGVSKIEISTAPAKTRYKLGETLNIDDIVVTATYTDNETEDVTAHISVSGFNSTTAGEKTITVTYGGQTDTFKVTVIPVVTFNPNGGNWNGNTGNKTVEVELNATVTKPDDPTNNGYGTFDNWYSDVECTVVFNFSNLITDNITLYANWNATYALGDTGPGGGKIFYRSETGFTMTDDNSIAHYLEAAPTDMTTTLAWASSAFIPPDWGGTGDWVDITGTAEGIGTGRKNTALILATDADAPAAKACNDYNNGGKNDWFLPSMDELNQLYVNKASIGIFEQNGGYWSSFQNSNFFALLQNFIAGNQGFNFKDYTYSVRAVRAF